ncbi:MAG: aminotransferase class I/II-fold pyridoxal phosphate-dependent enzyme, partial [Phycisphaerales bacterium]
MRSTFLPFCRPSIDDADVAAVEAVLRSGWITTGPKTAELEDAVRARTGAAHAVAFCSGTAAMHCLFLAAGLGPGDEVVTPSMTWVSTVNLLELLGVTPVFVDVDRDTLLATPEAMEAAITPRTKAIVPVHYAGAPVDLDGFRRVAAKHGVALWEDSAHAIGTRYRDEEIGAVGTGIFSLHPIKNVTSGEGGVFVTDDSELAARLRRLRFH